MPRARHASPSLSRSSILLLGLCTLLLSSPASAQLQRVVVLPFTGPQATTAQDEVTRVVAEHAELVPNDAWDASAQKLFATSRSAGDLSAVSADLNVQVIVTGKVLKKEAGWKLNVNVKHGPSGKTVVKLRYVLNGPRLDAATLQQLADEMVPAIDTAAAGPTAGSEADNGSAGEAIGEDAENPLAAPKKSDGGKGSTGKSGSSGGGASGGAGGELAERPSWSPIFDASVGLSLGGRSFAFDEPGTPSFSSKVTPGLHLDASLFPFALLAKHPGAGINAITGLGVGVTYLMYFWPDSIPNPCPDTDATGACTDHYATKQSSLDVGLRWHWNVTNTEGKPDLLVRVQYGERQFSIGKRERVDAKNVPIKDAMGNIIMDDVGPPDVDYQMVSIGIGGRVPFADRFSAFLNLDLHVLLGAGPIQTTDEWGPGGGWGLRFGGGIDVRVVAGLFVRLGASYERFALTFNNPDNGTIVMGGKPVPNNLPPCPCGTTGGATDTWYDFNLSVGYAL